MKVSYTEQHTLDLQPKDTDGIWWRAIIAYSFAHISFQIADKVFAWGWSAVTVICLLELGLIFWRNKIAKKLARELADNAS